MTAKIVCLKEKSIEPLPNEVTLISSPMEVDRVIHSAELARPAIEEIPEVLDD
jgi:hypothetical protein